MKVTSAHVIDLRIPTSDDLLGSDPFHTEPDYSIGCIALGDGLWFARCFSCFYDWCGNRLDVSWYRGLMPVGHWHGVGRLYSFTDYPL